MTSAINRTSAEELAKKLGIEKPKDAPILFPEVWDVASARMLIEAGYPLLSTSASAYAWAQGYRPGERVKLEELLIMAGRIVRDTKADLIADLEGCFDRSNLDIKRAVTAAMSVGCRGIFLCDGGRDGMHQLSGVMEVANRIKAARMAAIEARKNMVLVARTDALPLAALIANPFQEAITRANSYLTAGADLVHVTGVQTPELVKDLATAIDGPLTISVVHPNAPHLKEYEEMGVAAISLGTGLMRSALSDLKRKAEVLRLSGQCVHLEDAIKDNDLARLFTGQENPPKTRRMTG